MTVHCFSVCVLFSLFRRCDPVNIEDCEIRCMIVAQIITVLLFTIHKEEVNLQYTLSGAYHVVY